MPTNHLTHQPSSNLSKVDLAILDGVIRQFLGLGLAYSQWPAEVRRRGHEWYPELKNIIIKKEWEFFKSEIQLLQSEPEIAQSSRSNSKSLASILKRLKGESWIEGQPDEREKRLREHRLLGRDAKVRCLQKYARDWEQEAALSASPFSIQDATVKPTTDKAPGFSTMPENPAPEVESIYEMWDFNDITKVDARPIPGNVNIETETMHSVYDCPSQLSSSITPLLNHFEPFSAPTSNFDLLPSSQITAPLPNIETSGHYSESKLSGNLSKSPLAFNHHTAATSIDDSLIGEDAVPASADYNSSFDLPEGDLNIFTWMDKNIGLDDFESADTEAVLNTGGGLKNVSPSISPPRKRRKRRCQDTARASFEKSGCGNATPATSYLISDGDTMMSGFENSSQHTNELCSQLSSTQMAPPSGPLPLAPYPRLMSEPAFTNIRRHIELQQKLREELQRTRQELNSTRKKHQKELESSTRKLQARDTEISDLNKQIQGLIVQNEHYFLQIVELNNTKIILEGANSKKEIASGFSAGTKDKGHSTKLFQTFPAAKSPRPLSLTHRPALVSKYSSTSHKLSTSNMQDPSTQGFLIATSSSNRSSSSDNSQVSSEQLVPASSPSKSSSRNNQAGFEDSITSPNPGISTRKDPKPFQHLMHKISNQFQRRQFCDDNSRTGPIPLIPPLEASVPLNRQMAAVLVDSDKRLTNDSGYDSLQFEASSRASLADVE